MILEHTDKIFASKRLDKKMVNAQVNTLCIVAFGVPGGKHKHDMLAGHSCLHQFACRLKAVSFRLIEDNQQYIPVLVVSKAGFYL